MPCRAVIVALVGLSALLGLVSASNGARSAAPSYYVVRPDPRLCPSPLCGGHWVSLANQARTRCHDGLFRPRCYVTRAVDVRREPLSSPWPEALARAEIAQWEFEGPGVQKLGLLVVAEIWRPVGRPATGGFYRLRDTAVRCIRAPCFSFRGARLNGSLRVTLSDFDPGRVRASSDEIESARTALASDTGLLASGRPVGTPHGGRVFSASRFYLRAALPRA